MASAADFQPIRLAITDERHGRAHMRSMLGAQWWRQRGRAAWAGFAAEWAMCHSINTLSGPLWCRLAPTYDYDLAMGQHVDTLLDFERGSAPPLRCEVKTRAVSDGWVHPEKFNYVTVPTHEGREPVKDVDLVYFCWYSMSLPRVLWVLGYLRGVDEFKRRAQWYAEGEPLPRGGWAKEGGAYSLEIKNLRPLPAGMFKLEDL